MAIAVLTRPSTLVLQAVGIPVLLESLGAAGYGVFEAAISLTGWMALLGGGLSIGLLNGLVDCRAKRDDEAARRVMASVGLPMAGIGLFLCLLGVTFGPLVRCLSETVLDATQAEVVANGIFGLGLTAGLSLMASVPIAIYMSKQETHKNALWDALGKSVALGGCFVVARYHLGIGAAILAFAGAPHLVRIANGLLLMIGADRKLVPRRGSFSTQTCAHALRRSAAFLEMQAAFALLFSSDRIVVALLFGAEEAAQYSIVGRGFEMAYAALALLYTPIWPAYGEALLVGDREWVLRTKRRMLLLCTGAGILICLLGLAFGRTILGLWVGGEFQTSGWLLGAFGSTVILRSWVDNHSIILNAKSVLRPQLSVFTISGMVAVAASLLLGRIFGPVGVAWGVPLGIVSTSAWKFPLLVRKHVAGVES